MSSQQNTNKGLKQYSKSSHPAGQRDKSKYNNSKGKFAVNRDEQKSDTTIKTQKDTYISQEQLTEHLTAKLRENKFVEVKTKEITNEHGTLYEIDVINHGLYRIGNGKFYSMKLHTVSHKSRFIIITIVFNDNDTSNADMRINADTIIQIFREIAPNIIESIRIDDIDDSKGNKHLAVIAKTVIRASLNYTYERAMEFIHIVDEKYGASNDTSSKDENVCTSDLTTDQIDTETALLETKLKALKELKQAKINQSKFESANNDNVADTTTECKKDKIIRQPKIIITVDGKQKIINPNT